jgi:hypothetical protein
VPEVLRDEQFTYVRWVATRLQPIILRRRITRDELRQVPVARVSAEHRSWWSAEHGGSGVQQILWVECPAPESLDRWERAGRPELPASVLRSPPGGTAPLGGCRYLVGNNTLTRAELLDLSTEPTALYERLDAVAGTEARSVRHQISDTLSGPLPDGLAVALWDTLALAPGVQLVGDRADRKGRRGEAARVASRDGLEIELLFDRASAQLLTRRKVVADQDAHLLRLPVGTVVEEQIYLERTVSTLRPRSESAHAGRCRYALRPVAPRASSLQSNVSQPNHQRTPAAVKPGGLTAADPARGTPRWR